MLDSVRPRSTGQADDHAADDRALRCKLCEREVARLADRVSIGSGELHTFVNPRGEVFELVCFARAEGVVARGEATLEFTWFPGHAWRFGMCRTCGAQLGWHYRGDSNFWGLVRASLHWP
ncbi:cereblon family protein [Nannocystaceae bacterium ST9]